MSGLAPNTVGQTNWPVLSLQPVQAPDLFALHDIEKTAYSFPWSLPAFQDCLDSCYWVQKLCSHSLSEENLEGYVVAMLVLDEVHLLNVTVRPSSQGQGWGRYMLQQLQQWAHSQKAQAIWLEVRASNQKAIALYQAFGFIQKGRRKAYYPDAAGQREDALVMSLVLQEGVCI